LPQRLLLKAALWTYLFKRSLLNEFLTLLLT